MRAAVHRMGAHGGPEQRDPFVVGVVPPGTWPGRGQSLGQDRGGDGPAHMRRAVLDVLGQLQPAERRHPAAEVARGQPPRPPLLGDHQRARRAVGRDSGVEHDGQPGPTTERHRDDVSPAELAEVVGGLVAPAGGAAAGCFLLQPVELGDQTEVLLDVAEVAGHRLGVCRRSLLVALQLPRDTDHRRVRLVLRERLFQQVTRPLGTQSVQQIDGHVVARPETRPQRVQPP